MTMRIRPTTREEALHRAFAMLMVVPVPPDPTVPDCGHRSIAYRLDPGFNGGLDPEAEHCAQWSFGGRTPTADCVGLVAFASGIYREQPDYVGTTGHWLNCASLLADGKGARIWCEIVPDNHACAGDWLCTKDHIEIIVRAAIYVDGKRRQDHLSIGCSPRFCSLGSREAAIGLGKPWGIFSRPSVLRYRHYVGG